MKVGRLFFRHNERIEHIIDDIEPFGSPKFQAKDIIPLQAFPISTALKRAEAIFRGIYDALKITIEFATRAR